MKAQQRSYLLITRVRNEAAYLPGLFEAVTAQTVRPILWVLVDHDSQDESPEMVREFCEQHQWARTIHLPATDDYGIFSHARPLKAGFDFAVVEAAGSDLPYGHLGVLDADVVPEPAYFEKLLDFLAVSPKVGITGGRLYLDRNGKEVLEGKGMIPRGGARLYRRECYESIGGAMPESAIWDTETIIRATLRGWTVETVPGVRGLHRRVTYSRKGQWRGYWRLGKCAYYAHQHPLTVALTAGSYTLRVPFIYGAGYLTAYIAAWWKREPQTQNEEIRYYFWHSPGRVFRRLFEPLRRVFTAR